MELQPQWFTEGMAEYTASRQDKSESTFALQAAKQDQLLYGGKLDIADARFDVIETSVVYKQGHSMCIYLAEKYGEDVFRRIIAAYSSTPQWDLAFRIATGARVEEFYQDWLQRLRRRADQLPDSDLLTATEAYPARLEAALGGRMSPDGRTIAVYGVEDWEDPIPGLFLMSADGRFFHKIAGHLDLYDSWKLSWSADSRYLMYAGRTKSPTGAVLNAVFVYDQQREKGWKLDTGRVRLGEPELSPDGTRVAFVNYRDERAVLATMSIDGDDVRLLTADQPFDAFSPTWSPDGQRLAFSLVDPQGTDLATIGADGDGLQRLTNDAWPDQYPDWSPDGRALAFVSYRRPGQRSDAAVSAEAQGLAAAATNLYVMPAGGGELRQLTERSRGAPTTRPDAGQPACFQPVRVAMRVCDNSRSTPAAGRVALNQPSRSGWLVAAAGPPQVGPAAGDGTAAAPAAFHSPTPLEPPATPPRWRPPRLNSARRRPLRGAEVQRFARTRNFVTRRSTMTRLGDRSGSHRWSDPLPQHLITAEAAMGPARATSGPRRRST